jgi:sulfatase maturation enzyme AslB (radical SAM superfamily)
MMKKRFLKYDKTKWKEVPVAEVNTLQLFITNKCNLRCKACFNKHNLGKGEMTVGEYLGHVSKYKDEIRKIVLMGGEPTLFKQLPAIIAINQSLGLKTTIYTNGANLEILEGINTDRVKVRVGVMGAYSSEKPLSMVHRTKLPLEVVYMVRADNTKEIMAAAKMAEKEFNCKTFFISSIRDIADTESYWEDNEGTVPNEEYFEIVQDFLEEYKGNLNIDISKRAVMKSKYEGAAKTCRFGNIFPDGSKIQCPFDIALKKECKELQFGKRKCRHDELCILRKISLRKIT